MAQTRIIGTVGTKIIKDEGFTMVRYHETDVVKFNDTFIMLRNDGWKTNTTKTRINQAANQFGLGFRLAQVKGDWIITQHGIDIPFYDGICLQRN